MGLWWPPAASYNCAQVRHHSPAGTFTRVPGRCLRWSPTSQGPQWPPANICILIEVLHLYRCVTHTHTPALFFWWVESASARSWCSPSWMPRWAVSSTASLPKRRTCIRLWAWKSPFADWDLLPFFLGNRLQLPCPSWRPWSSWWKAQLLRSRSQQFPQ